jgi:DNA-binding response OmpR family regulator
MRGERLVSGLRQRVPLILVADDEERSREQNAWYLKYAGFKVEVVATGEDALAVSPRLRPSVVLIDLALQDVPGLEVVRRLKADERTTSAVVVALGARGDEAYESAHQAGCDVLLPKPCSPQRLVATVMRVLGAARRAQEA